MTVKHLAVLDLDNTLLNTLQLWGESLGGLIEDFIRTYDVAPKIVHDMIREAPGQYRFNDGVTLLDWMIENDPVLQPRHLELKTEWNKASGNPIAQRWLETSARHSVFYDGVLETLKALHGIGARSVIQTDAEDSAVCRRLWLLGLNAAKAGQLKSPHEILDLFDRIYCQQDIIHSADYLHGIDLSFIKALQQKIHCWSDRLYKPAASHLRHIVEHAGVDPAQVVYAGDTHKDGLEARSLGVAFAWSRYGTPVTETTMALYDKVGSKSYSYGTEVIAREMQERGVIPAAVLETSFAEIARKFRWGPR